MRRSNANRCHFGKVLSAGRTPAARLALQNGQLFLRLRGRALADEIAEGKYERVRNRVNTAGALLATRNQAPMQQKIQVFGDVRLIGFKILYQFGNSLFRPGQGLEDPQPERLAQVTEALRDQFERSAGEGDLTHALRISLYAHIVLTEKNR